MTVIEKEKVRQMRLESITFAQIASGLGLSINTVKSYCRRNALPVGGVDSAPK
jgi:DNA-binding CsgD family transcriptional regulator